MLDQETLSKLYAVYPILQVIADDLRDAVLKNAKRLSIAKGHILFNEQQACKAFPFVLEGTVKVFKTSANGRELPLYRVTPGDACVVTAGCLLGNHPYHACGMTQTDCEFVVMPDQDFNLLLANKEFRQYVFALFSERMLELMQLIEEVAFRKLDQRLAGYLVTHGPVIRVSHQQLADELGSVREIISRVLKNFADAGALMLGRENIEILDHSFLHKIMVS